MDNRYKNESHLSDGTEDRLQAVSIKHPITYCDPGYAFGARQAIVVKPSKKGRAPE